MAMNNDRYQNEPGLGHEAIDAQTRIFLNLVFDVWEALEKYDQYFLSTDPPRSAAQWETNGSEPIDNKDSMAAILWADSESQRGHNNLDRSHSCD